jgi:Gluconolactonase
MAIIRSKNLSTGQIGEYPTDEAVGFQIPRANGGDILGTANGPVLRDVDGKLTKLATRQDADGYPDKHKLRWNDAKISPDGYLFLGSMAYENQSNEGAFYRLSKDGQKLNDYLVMSASQMVWTGVKI